jgi:hypothetical protein
MPWVGPFRVRELLERCIDSEQPWPPEDHGVYVVTESEWSDDPASSGCVLYVGGNTGKGGRFRTRIGDLLADACGFFGSETGHHSGGYSLHLWCREHGHKPLELWIGWREGVACRRCAEIEVYERLHPQLNKKRPGSCPDHDLSVG